LKFLLALTFEIGGRITKKLKCGKTFTFLGKYFLLFTIEEVSSYQKSLKKNKFLRNAFKNFKKYSRVTPLIKHYKTNWIGKT